MKMSWLFAIAFLSSLSYGQFLYAGTASTAIRDTAEFIAAKFPKSLGGKTVDQIAESTAKAVSRNGEGVLPMLKLTGPAGFKYLEDAGEKAPDVIKLFVRKGNEAIWIVSKPKKLAIFLRHGDSAADALIKHPGIADSLITRFGDDAAGALNSLSRQNAQRLAIVANDGVLSASARSAELLPVIRQYGDSAMEFIWRNKGALIVTAVLATFLNDPQPYIQGLKDLIVDPIARPIAENTNWTLIISVGLLIIFLPFVTRSFLRARSVMRKNEI